jgi:phage tail-like protein
MPVTIQELFVTDTWRVEISGLTIGVFTHCTGLRVQREMLDYAEGGNNEQIHHLPGRVSYGTITLSRGLTDEKALLDWFFKPADKKEVTVTLEQGGGSLKRGWTFADAYPVAWSGPDLNAGSGDVAGETLEIAHSGIQQV